MRANNHLGAMNAILSTPENLEGAISGEDHEYESMYPEMIETAKAEKLNDAEMSFYLANEVEKIHSELFNRLLSNQGKSTETFPYYVCLYCGNTVEKEPPATCSVCGADGKLFKRVD